MGSFTSKIAVTPKNANHHRKSKATIDGREILESVENTEPANDTNKGKWMSDSTSEEQPRSSSALQSYSWLVSSPVDLVINENEQKETLKRPEETRNKAKYNNGNYLKSYQPFAKIPAATETKRKAKSPQVMPGASALSPSLENHSNYPSYCKSGDRGEQKMKGTTRQTKSTSENHTDCSSILRVPSAVVGFEVETDVCRRGRRSANRFSRHLSPTTS